MDKMVIAFLVLIAVITLTAVADSVLAAGRHNRHG